MEWLIGVCLLGVLVLFAWALCLTARRADDEAEQMHEDLRRREGVDE